MARIGFSIASVLATILLGAIYGLPMAILVLAAGALLGSITLFWTSLHTLTSTDLDLEPYRAKAEEIVRAHLARRGAEKAIEMGGIDPALANTESYESRESPKRNDNLVDRVMCTDCDESNEHDARFCKRCGVALRATETSQ
ncbi:MAG: hypothetical protein FWD73_02845 [Polyangiaceae bacterium]|nr:hypothetical protein [Polyangiaceae bacterium]